MTPDSLAFALLISLLAQMSDSLGIDPSDLVVDSFSVSMSVDVAIDSQANSTDSSEPFNAAFIGQPLAVVKPTRDVIAHTPADASRMTGIGSVSHWLERNLGFLSVRDTHGPPGWLLRTTIFQSNLTLREKEIRWSLVHGLF